MRPNGLGNEETQCSPTEIERATSRLVAQCLNQLRSNNNNNNNNKTAIGLSPGSSGYFTCIQNMKLVTNKFKSGGLHEKHVVATWNVGKSLSMCL